MDIQEDLFGEEGMDVLALKGSHPYIASASDTLHGSAVFTSNVLSDFTIQAASHRMQESPDLLQGMNRVHTIYTNPANSGEPHIRTANYSVEHQTLHCLFAVAM